MNDLLPFACDYQYAAHPLILKRLNELSQCAFSGYGSDPLTARAAEKIKVACRAPEASVFFLSGGTQTNALALSALTAPTCGVISAETGHIACHEAGAVEACSLKVITLPHKEGKISSSDLESLVCGFERDENRDHCVFPGTVYISHPTEFGTLYSKDELTSLRAVCLRHGLRLYLDGARLAYALGSSSNDLTLPDIARLTDAFCIGGTKTGALLGEALVFTEKPDLRMISYIKSKGALLAKGWLLALPFDVFFENGLYESIGREADRAADRIRRAMSELNIETEVFSPTNQIFPVFTEEQLSHFRKRVSFSFWCRKDDGRTVVRLATSCFTKEKDVTALIASLKDAVMHGQR